MTTSPARHLAARHRTGWHIAGRRLAGRYLLAQWLAGALALVAATSVMAAPPAVVTQRLDNGIAIDQGADQLTIRLLAPGIIHVHYKPDGQASAASLVMDPHATPAAFTPTRIDRNADGANIDSTRVAMHWDKATGALQIDDAQHRRLLSTDLTALKNGQLVLQHNPHDALYGIGGYDAFDTHDQGGLLRHGKWQAKAGEQGYAGAPLVWSTAGYGVLVDTIGGNFNLQPGRISVSGTSRKDLDYYILLGTPAQIFAAVSQLSGHTPMFPKWAMGFTNSQWGIDEKELLGIVDTYRAKHIPIDNFTLDFDWKAWGDDNYGEFRWNTAKFPDGPSGKLGELLKQRGMHLTGIMKPRLHVDTVEGRYATVHDFWSPHSKAAPDYFSHKLVRELDFDQPAVRSWFFNPVLKHSFDTGMHGWWNDEADDIGSDTQFTNMERALYDGQRAYSPLRVWSINRNFYLGAQRYAYGLWSGDIATGFASMAGQRQRMLSAIDVGAMQWGMDGGGFKGHPSDENYARWIEFGAFTPIFRVHGVFGEKRQPWVYGPVAEKAATAAIRLRYALIPYIYSYEYRRHVDGVGLVRPLLFDWPHDPKVRNDVSAWMFGDWLLVSPVVQPKQTSKRIYLPAGTWTDWFSGKVYAGGQTITVNTDSKGWADIPLFIRAGAIIPTQPPMDYVGEKPLTQLTVDVFPAAQRSTFDYYDDDGRTYAYEQGASFRQTLAVQRSGQGVHLDISAAVGSYQPPLKFYLLAIHGGAAQAVTEEAHALPRVANLDALAAGSGEGWATGTDRYGAVTWVRVAAGRAKSVRLVLPR